MKKLATALAAVLIVAGMATSALANPGWSNDHRQDNRGRFERQPIHYQHDHHNQWAQNRQTVVVQRGPVVLTRPVVHAYEPQAASFSMFLPGFSIRVR